MPRTVEVPHHPVSRYAGDRSSCSEIHDAGGSIATNKFQGYATTEETADSKAELIGLTADIVAAYVAAPMLASYS
ncbi:hypothetical protein [Mesorhizobium sp. INR15]|uniref:hypothetical protein n=1 Tax=Mesorhizobium sp. INR15 TaxID=2654248 RepID=UPI0018966849|nr:hypothetical protein [Mesorhizobium sp. INR15]QPC95559.1 hypothetical protein GA829_33825 [Mesorhizobium sp. INR15]